MTIVRNDVTTGQVGISAPDGVPGGQPPAWPALVAVDEAAQTVEAPATTVSLVIPALNEQKNIGWVLDRLPPSVSEVILVDGHSTDDTVKIAREIRPDIVVVTQNGRGKGEALRTGFAAATGEIIVMIDADGSMDPGEIERYVTPLLNGYDLVKGSRFLAGGGSTDLTPLRRAGNSALVRVTNALFFVRFTDLCYGYCSFRRAVLPDLSLTAQGFEIETELILRAVKATLRIAEVPSMEAPRRWGLSNLRTFRDGQRVLRTLLRERMVRSPRRAEQPAERHEPHHWGNAPVTHSVPVGQETPAC